MRKINRRNLRYFYNIEEENFRNGPISPILPTPKKGKYDSENNSQTGNIDAAKKVPTACQDRIAKREFYTAGESRIVSRKFRTGREAKIRNQKAYPSFDALRTSTQIVFDGRENDREKNRVGKAYDGREKNHGWRFSAPW